MVLPDGDLHLAMLLAQKSLTLEDDDKTTFFLLLFWLSSLPFRSERERHPVYALG